MGRTVAAVFFYHVYMTVCHLRHGAGTRAGKTYFAFRRMEPNTEPTQEDETLPGQLKTKIQLK